VVEVEEQGLVEQFVEHPSVEALHKTMLDRLAWRDIAPGDAVILGSGQNGLRGALRAFADDHGRPRRAINTDNARATRRPEIEVSGSAPDIPVRHHPSLPLAMSACGATVHQYAKFLKCARPAEPPGQAEISLGRETASFST